MDGKILPVLSLVIAETVCFGRFHPRSRHCVCNILIITACRSFHLPHRTMCNCPFVSTSLFTGMLPSYLDIRRHGFQSYLKTLMGLFCVVMYAIAMAHWTLTIRRMSYDATVLQNAINNGIMSVEDDAIIFGDDSILCAATPLLTVNVSIGVGASKLIYTNNPPAGNNW